MTQRSVYNILKKYYHFLFIGLFLSGFLISFRNDNFFESRELIDSYLPRMSALKYRDLLDYFWNSLSASGMPFFSEPFNKMFSILSLPFHFFKPRDAFILYCVEVYFLSFIAFYCLSKYFYKDRFIASLLSLMYVTSGLLSGRITAFIASIEYFVFFPFLIIFIHKYVKTRNVLFLSIVLVLNIIMNLPMHIGSLLLIHILLNFFFIQFLYSESGLNKGFFKHIIMVNVLLIASMLFKIIPSIEYYFIEGFREIYFEEPTYGDSIITIATYSIQQIYRLVLLTFFMQESMSVNLHFLSISLLTSYFLFKPNYIEKISMRTFLVFFIMFIMMIASKALPLESNPARIVLAEKLFCYVHIPGILMLGQGIRVYLINNSDLRKRVIALLMFLIVYALVTIKSFIELIVRNDPDNFNYLYMPFYWGIFLFILIFFVKNNFTRKSVLVCSVLFIGVLGLLIGQFRTFEIARNDRNYGHRYIEAFQKGLKTHEEIVHAENLYDKDLKSLSDYYRIAGVIPSEFVPKEPGGVIYPWDILPMISIHNLSMYYGQSSINSHDNVILKRYKEYMEMIDTSFNHLDHIQAIDISDRALNSPLFPFLSIKYILSKNELFINKHLSLIGDSHEEGVYIYRNKDWVPRFYISNKYKYYNSKEEFIRIVKEEDDNLREIALLEGLEPKKSEMEKEFKLKYDIDIVEYKNDSVTLKVNTNDSGFLVFLDNYYPGWKAYINNQRVQVHRTLWTFKGVYIPDEGEHTVVFKYEPTFFKSGIILSIFTIILTLIIYKLGLTRSRSLRHL